MRQLPLFEDDTSRLTRAAWRARLEAEAAPPCRCEDADDHCVHCRCEDCVTWERVWLAALTGKTRPDSLPLPPGAGEDPGAPAEIAMLEAMLGED